MANRGFNQKHDGKQEKVESEDLSEHKGPKRQTEIHVTFSNGEKWSVPASVVAKSRAEYYAKKDKDTTYDEEFAYTMGEDNELTDWMHNDMNWSDIQPHATKLDIAGDIDRDDEFSNTEADVVRQE